MKARLSDIIKAWNAPSPPPKMIKKKCLICGKEFKGTVKIDICPTCNV